MEEEDDELIDPLEVMAAMEEDRVARLLNARWTLGWHDRGHGHGDYGVITEAGELVVPNVARATADHIIELHNGSLEVSHQTASGN